MKKTILTILIFAFLVSCNSSSESKEDNWTSEDVEKIMSDSKKLKKKDKKRKDTII